MRIIIKCFYIAENRFRIKLKTIYFEKYIVLCIHTWFDDVDDCWSKSILDRSIIVVNVVVVVVVIVVVFDCCCVVWLFNSQSQSLINCCWSLTIICSWLSSSKIIFWSITNRYTNYVNYIIYVYVK